MCCALARKNKCLNVTFGQWPGSFFSGPKHVLSEPHIFPHPLEWGCWILLIFAFLPPPPPPPTHPFYSRQIPPQNPWNASSRPLYPTDSAPESLESFQASPIPDRFISRIFGIPPVVPYTRQIQPQNLWNPSSHPLYPTDSASESWSVLPVAYQMIPDDSRWHKSPPDVSGYR